MSTQYQFTEIETKWCKYWEEHSVNEGHEGRPKYYCLDMFPYPSASGLHVGHWRGYVLSDVLSRYKVLQGYQVLHPMGWDAFGLPAENYAIKVGEHPAKVTAENIQNFKRQLHEITAMYDWSKELATTDPEFYKWTQWIFVQMYKQGLAYEKEMPLNWCPSCKAVLANEEATSGVCDRCGSVVTKKMLRQWMLRITAYAERLLNDLEGLEWPEKVKKMQADWIGKSYGAEVDFAVENSHHSIKVFTTRPDTLYGATFMVLAPEHALINEITTPERQAEMERYVFAASTKSSVDRMSDKDKTGVFTGCYGVNPLNGARMPIWVSDYVLSDYGTGAIMCVPAHDERDFDFAQKFGLPIVQVIAREAGGNAPLTEAYTEEGVMINSEDFNGMKSSEAKTKVADYLESKGIGKKTVNYKLRDWVFSRQRYWGEPIPIIHCPDCGIVTVPEDKLPVLLPMVKSYQPTATGESPLADIPEFVNTTCPYCGKPAKRETNTMPQWAGSSWYFLRYPDARNNEALAGKEALENWLPVDYYVGGIEHAVLHLLYARFYTKVLYDIGAVNFQEPFQRLFNQGMINKDGVKMSKSKGNVVSPDELVARYGCDSLRMYELFIAPPELDAEWDDRGIDGTFRYLNKVWKFVLDTPEKPENKDIAYFRNKMVYEITHRIDHLSMNTVVSGLMEYTNKLNELAKANGGIDRQTLETLIVLLSPICPHIAQELWQRLGHTDDIFDRQWPACDESKLVRDEIEIAVQVNGKLRLSIQIPAAAEKDEALHTAKEALGSRLDGAEIVKEIYVPGKVVNIVIKN